METNKIDRNLINTGRAGSTAQPVSKVSFILPLPKHSPTRLSGSHNAAKRASTQAPVYARPTRPQLRPSHSRRTYLRARRLDGALKKGLERINEYFFLCHQCLTNNIRNLLRAFGKAGASHPLICKACVLGESKRFRTSSPFPGAFGNFSRNSMNVNYAYCRTLATSV